MRHKKTLKRLADYRLTHPDDPRDDDLVIAEMQQVAAAKRMAAYRAVPKNKAAKAKCAAVYNAIPENKAARNARHHVRYQTDIPYRLTVLTRSRILAALKSHAKDKHTIELLGCTGLFYQAFLEDQFTDGMTWENHGTLWHIDHIIPIASFDLEDSIQLAQAFHYTNTQPLLAAHNLSKGSKLDWIKPSA